MFFIFIKSKECFNLKKSTHDFILYGKYQNKVFFPNNEITIGQYVEILFPLIAAIRSEEDYEVYNLLKTNSVGNVFVTAIVIAALRKYKPDYAELLIRDVENKYDFFIALNVLKATKCPNIQKYLNAIYEEKPYIFEDKEKYFKNKIFMTPALAAKYKKRNMVIEKLKKALSDGTFGERELELLIDNEIHFNELGSCLSYTFSPIVKCRTFEYFLNKFKIGDLIYCIDKSFTREIPEEILGLISEKIVNNGTFEDYIYLLAHMEEFKNPFLKNLVKENVEKIDYKLLATNKVCPFEEIRIIVSPKYYTNVNPKDKTRYIHCVAVFSSLLSEIYDKPLYIENKEIQGNLTEKIETIDNSTYTMEMNKDYNRYCNENTFAFSTMPSVSSIRWDVCGDMNSSTENTKIALNGINVKVMSNLFFTNFCGVYDIER